MVPPPPIRIGAMLRCSFGSTPTNLRVNRPSQIANIHDSTPFANIPAFGMCRSMDNPAVAAASAAVHGELITMPCMPMCAAGAWTPGYPVQLVGPPQAPALGRNSTLLCEYGGLIQIIG
jgi:hypothetical protein